MEDTYSNADWCRERALVDAGRVLPCPACGHREYFSPYAVATDDGSLRLYRGCKVCGFWQDTGEDSVRCVWTSHVCLAKIPSGETCGCCDSDGPLSFHICSRIVGEEEIEGGEYTHDDSGCNITLGPEHRIAMAAEPDI